MNRLAEIHDSRSLVPMIQSMLDPDNGPDPIVVELIDQLQPTSNIYEFGAWMGRNSLFLAKNGHILTAQDISARVLETLSQRAETLGVSIQIECSSLPEPNSTKKYEAVVCTRVLHFLERVDALSAINTLQHNTRVWGYHSFVLFTAGTIPQKAPGIENPFFPTEEELTDLYAGWEIITRFVKPSKLGDQGQVFEGIDLLLRKPDIA